MTTEKSFERLKLAALDLKAALIDMDDNIQPTVNEIDEISKRLRSLGEELTVYKFLKTQKEISPNFNIHVKVMEKANHQSDISGDEIMHEKISKVVSASETIQATRKLEIGLNDKFRMISELFNNNSTEFNLAMEQLNLISELEKSEVYLQELMRLYNWKNDHELTLRLFALNKKRFSK